MEALQNTEATESHSEEQGVILRGDVQRITYHNPENGYTVLQISIPEQTELATVVGSTIDIQAGASIVARGEYVTHPKFGRQLKASSITLVTPSSPEGIQKYLGSGMIKGIGPKTAERLVAAFGEETLEVIHRYPKKIARIPGIGRKKAELISKAFAETAETQEIMRFLIEHNISTGLASRIYKRYESRAIEVLQKDPYLLARQMQGVGFATADAIALNLGLSTDSPQRLKAGLYYALEKARDEGHCFLSLDLLIRRAATLLGLEDEGSLTQHVAALEVEGYVVSEDEAIFLKRLYESEAFVASFIADRLQPSTDSGPYTEQVNASLDAAAHDLKIEFSYEQRQAVHYATQFPLLLITGGPGCGKTTVIRALVATFKSNGMKLALAAPTGRAAQRMAQVCGTPASTIHRLLRYDPIKRGFMYGINQPLEVDGEEIEVLIIDEASMIDINLARDLFSAIPSHARIVLVGDKDQLPSVGPGRMFGDLIERREVQTVSLSQLFRRAEASTINSVAHMINAGIPPSIPAPDGGVTKTDAYFIDRREPEAAAATIESLVSDQIPRKFGIAIKDITVLTPSNRGPLGTIALNQRLQNCLNPLDNIDPEQTIEVNNQQFRIGDRVCQRVNNYNIDSYGVFNGDNGIIYEVNRADKNIVVELWDGRLIRYDTGSLSQLSLAYTSTVHRSQGTEIPCVVLALHESHFTLLERQLIYTGVTRAKQLLIVVGSPKALALSAKRMSGHKRCTLLSDRIEKLLKK